MTQRHRYLPLLAVLASAAIAAVIACGFVVTTSAATPADAPLAAAGTTTTTGNPDCPAATAEFDRVKEKMRAAKERVAAARESGNPQRVERAIAHKREVRQERIAAKAAFREACGGPTGPTETVTQTATETVTQTATQTATQTVTQTATQTVTQTATETVTRTETVTQNPTLTR